MHTVRSAQAAPPLPTPAADPFAARLRRDNLDLRRRTPTTLQVNLGKRCNQACHHCHVDAGPTRTEVMAAPTLQRVISLLAASPEVHTVDITGGAPELHPGFRDLVTRSRAAGRAVIDRCNLTVLLLPEQEGLAEFLAGQEVVITASLPCYTEANVDAQRGRGVFEQSLAALRLLNDLGYGTSDGRLRLDLVYNPGGPFLPGGQASLEADYKRELGDAYGIRFDRLLTLTNVPLSRFAADLSRRGKLAAYETLLADNFNPATVPSLMCRDLVSVGYDGRLYDCDFHQMAELPLGAGARTVFEIEHLGRLRDAPIHTAAHCFACTAGAGSSCGGALAERRPVATPTATE